MKVLLGMSGGLDSTVSAHILKERGFEVEGASLLMHEYTDISGAQRSADELHVPLHVIDCRNTFRDAVMRPFADEYMRGRTPNPCIFCNPAVKFGFLTAFARDNGFDMTATGHYAGVTERGGRYCITRAADFKKDQSYALWGLTQEELSHLMLPLAGYTKDELRTLAASLGYSAAASPESQEICFIPDNDYSGWLSREFGYKPVPGNFIDVNGNVLGMHSGIANYTVGQRKRLGIALGKPVYVTSVDYNTNTVTLAESGGEYSSCMTVSGLNFQSVSADEADGTHSFNVRIRYAAQPVPAEVTVNGGSAAVRFSEPARAVTPGQSAVFYDGDRIAFGGYIGESQ